jgi:tRNA uridine 5-carbamoylmethylation protein Kti12
MTTALFLVGMPGAGKSTFRELCRGYLVASSDDFIEAQAKELGKTYNDVFQTFIEPATKHFNHMVSHAVSLKLPLIVDRTNLTVSSRAKVLAKIPVAWKKVAIVFSPIDREEWVRRLANRPGKVIPQDVLDRMEKSFEEPTVSEGFDSVIRYRT